MLWFDVKQARLSTRGVTSLFITPLWFDVKQARLSTMSSLVLEQ